MDYFHSAVKMKSLSCHTIGLVIHQFAMFKFTSLHEKGFIKQAETIGLSLVAIDNQK